MTTEVAIAPATPEHPPAPERAPRRGLDWFEAAVLAVFAAVSIWILALDLWQVVVHHRIWTGTDGLFLADQMQYLAWIRDVSNHFLISNMFVLRPTPHDYFQPVVVIAAGITRLGVPVWLSLLLWKPVAVIAAFLGIRAYTRHTLAWRFDRRAALVLALFFGAWGVVGDEWMPFWSWGYPFGLLAVAAMAGALICYDSARARNGFTWLAPLLGLVASFTHPWQGELLVLIVIGAEAVTWHRGVNIRQRIKLPLATLIATGLPLVYYELLDRFDPSWRGAQAASKHVFSLSGIVVPLVPLLIAAVLAYRRRPSSFIDAATRTWPFAALAIFGLSETGLSGTPLHAFAGITIPLAVLAVEGVQSVGFRRLPQWRLVAVVLVALATIPAGIDQMRSAKSYVTPAPYYANFITRGDRDALDYLASYPKPGGVLAREYLGLIVPADTGRNTYVGSGQWSGPDRALRVTDTLHLFKGLDSPAVARSFVRSTSAKFLLQDCNSRGNLVAALGPMIRSVKRFGCAAVYELNS